jgi:hypothetical protein
MSLVVFPAATRNRATAAVRPEGDQLFEAVRLQHELADVDGHVSAGDVGNDDMEPEPSGIIASTNGVYMSMRRSEVRNLL